MDPYCLASVIVPTVSALQPLLPFDIIAAVLQLWLRLFVAAHNSSNDVRDISSGRVGGKLHC